MRLITKKKVHRAFPELDEFSDARCHRLIKRLKNELGYVPMMVTLIIVLVPLWFVLVALAANFFGRLVWDHMQSLLGRTAGDLAAMVMILFVLIAPPGVIGLVARDLTLWFHLHRALRRTIRLAQCRGCRYLLLGQRIVGGFITCPECGRETTLAELGLGSPAELLPPEDDEDMGLSRLMAEEEEEPPSPPPTDGSATVQRLKAVRDDVRAAAPRTGSEPREES